MLAVLMAKVMRGLIALVTVSGALLSSIPVSAGTVTHIYDVMDRLASRTDATGAIERFVYDGMGNLTGFTDRKGQAPVSTTRRTARWSSATSN